MALGPTASIGDRQKRVLLQNPGTPVRDGDGSFTQTWTDVAGGAAFAHVAPASARSLERITAGTVLATATHVVTLPYRAGISTKTRVMVDGRQLNVTSVQDPDDRHVELILVCEEVVA
jgi:SPP1 family predicted phage head-tail adaptor